MSVRADGTAYEQDRTQDYIDQMQAQGFRVYYPRDNELQLDFDSLEALRAGDKLMDALEDRCYGYITNRLQTESKSGKGWHVRLMIAEYPTPDRRVALQAALGSDPMRELLSMSRLLMDLPKEHISILVESAETAKEIDAWFQRWDNWMLQIHKETAP